MGVNVYAEARAFLQSYLPNLDMSIFSDAEIRGNVDQLWTGGWPAFVEEHTGKAVTTDDMTDIQKLAYIHDLTGYRIRLGLIDEITDFKATESDLVVVIDHFELTEYHNRLRAIKHATKMVGWKMKDGRWVKLDTTYLWDEDFEPFQVVGQYGRVTTADIYNDRVWQDNACYRPGTARSPMDGNCALSPTIPYREEV